MDTQFWIQVFSFLLLIVYYGNGIKIVTEIQNGNHDNFTTQSDLTKEEQRINYSLFHMNRPELNGVTLTLQTTKTVDAISLTENAT